MENLTDDCPEALVEASDIRDPAYCRAVLRYFHSRETEVATVDDLGTFVSDDDQSEEDRSRIVIRLHHVTLPKLADAGLVDYDARSNTARYRAARRSGRDA